MKDSHIDFVWHSNRIDWNAIDPNALTRETCVRASDGDPSTPQEIRDHFVALSFVLEMVMKKKHPPVEDVIKTIHRLLMQNIYQEIAGRYRTWSVVVGGEIAPRHTFIPKLMKHLCQEIQQNYSFLDTMTVHNRFECIHPFADGNGRTGRLLWNYLRLLQKSGVSLVEVEKKAAYYEEIRKYRKNYFREDPDGEHVDVSHVVTENLTTRAGSGFFSTTEQGSTVSIPSYAELAMPPAGRFYSMEGVPVEIPLNPPEAWRGGRPMMIDPAIVDSQDE